jgi:predicted RNase H-like HicB family nuclease
MMIETDAPPTRFSVGLEEGTDGWTHVHSLGIPGCTATGATREEALNAFSTVLAGWLEFLAGEGEAVPPTGSELEIAVDEWVLTEAAVAAGQSDTCFEADREPIETAEVLRNLRRLGALRGRLLPYIRRARDADLEAIRAADWNVRLVLDELARAQWWTLTRLGASPLAEVPPAVVARLDTAMALIVHTLATLPAERLGAVVDIEGEEWTVRRVLRRLLWLEWALGGAALHAMRSREERAG